MKKSAKKRVTHKTNRHHHTTVINQIEKKAVQLSNKKIIITIAIIVVLVVGLLLILLGKGDSTMGKNVLAKVNGEPVFSEEVDRLFAQAAQQGFPVQREQVIEQVITKKVLVQEAKKQKITIDDAAVDKYLADLEKLIGQSIEPLLERMNLSKEEFRQQIQEQLMITELIKIKQAPAPTDTEVQTFYEGNEEYFVAPEQVNASHILVATEEEAKEILIRLNKGEDFATVAKEKSIDPSAKMNGGNLGLFGKGQMVPEFENAAMALEVETFSEPIKTQFGYHIIVVHEKKKAGKISFVEAKADIIKIIQDEKTKVNVDAYAKELVAKAKIERFAPEEKK
ncbi:MAG TPA: peptidylprolyl isomerase [Candidatus Nanoarchaeia archaeon]|nr:peptidylprolyl isomerase [Candidatus Nanoarchaeia archaeon]